MVTDAPLISYPDDEVGDAMFERTCKTCNRFVKADASITTSVDGQYWGETGDKTTATCKKCGRTEMYFLGWW